MMMCHVRHGNITSPRQSLHTPLFIDSLHFSPLILTSSIASLYFSQRLGISLPCTISEWLVHVLVDVMFGCAGRLCWFTIGTIRRRCVQIGRRAWHSFHSIKLSVVSTLTNPFHIAITSQTPMLTHHVASLHQSTNRQQHDYPHH